MPLPRIHIGSPLGSTVVLGAAVKPDTEDWIDLSTSGTLTLAPDASLGFHDHSYDIAVGPKGDTTVWAQDADGLYLTVDAASVETAGLIVQPAACSLRYDPYFEIVWKAGTTNPTIHLGLVSEAVGDHGIAQTSNVHRGYLLSSSAAAYNVTRATVASLIGSYVFIANNYYRMLIHPEDGGLMQMYDLGLAPANYDGGSLIAPVSGYVSRSMQLQGGNVIAPCIVPQTVALAYGARIVATRTTLRRP